MGANMTTQEIDVLKLYAGTIPGFADNMAWNRWLSLCLNSGNLNELMSVRKGIQMGMATAQKKNLVSEELAVIFCRWTHSIDLTVKKIIKKREGKLQHKDKKQLDNDMEIFLRKESF
jgi:hypothetical protein